MGHIFISYSHKDTYYAHGLANDLQSIGLEVWIDARLDYGQQWPQEIQKQLDNCDAFIIIMSPRSFASEWVQSELQRAKRKIKPIFPLLLEGDEPWLSIESTQFYDVRGGKFPDAKFYSALKRVISFKQDAPTFHVLKKPEKTEPIARVSAPKYRMGTMLAIVGSMVTIFAICAVVFVGLFSTFFVKRLKFSVVMSPTSMVTLTPNSSSPIILQSTLYSSPTLSAAETPSPTETLIPTKTLVPTLPPTLAPVIPTPIPPPPSPIGGWAVTANDYPGELNIITVNNGNISGTIFGNRIEGTWDESTQGITFTRFNSSDPNIYQLYYGEQRKQGKKYILSGSFEDHDANGNVGTYSWSAER
jgi:hypothetical protein